MNNFIPVEKYIHPLDPNIWWFYIPGFNGYEISNTNLIRSMKHFHKYPFGILVKPREVNDISELFTKSFPDLHYELSNDCNVRTPIKLSELQYLARTNQYAVSGYPRRTNITDCASRNQRISLQRQLPYTVSDMEKARKLKDNIEKEIDSQISSGGIINMQKEMPHVICPISFDERVKFAYRNSVPKGRRGAKPKQKQAPVEEEKEYIIYED